jgi:predicted glycoside hydrolase/deacetylase ChbG (UPF0249 family)
LSSRKQLVVNADDFGFTPDVNRGIVDAHRGGILTATTLMANGAAFDDAVQLARQTPSLDIGCHLVLVGDRSLVSGKPFPLTVGQLLAALARREIRPYEELAAQVQRILDAGIRPTHLDTHKHTHLAPPVLDAVARLSETFGIRWVRRPFDFPLHALRGTVPRLEAADERRDGIAAAAISSRARTARVPDHRPFRRVPDYRPLPHRGAGGTAREPAGRQHGIDVPSGLLRRESARGADPLEREPRTGAGGVDGAGDANGSGAVWDRAGGLRGPGVATHGEFR